MAGRARAPKQATGKAGAGRIPEGALSIWDEDGLTRFKPAEIVIAENRSNAALERAARQRAAPVEGALVYAYLLDPARSSVWWREWGGHDLEQEWLTAAVLARPEVKTLLADFNPKRNPSGPTRRADYIDMLVESHHAAIDADDIRRGVGDWLAALPAAARQLFLTDLARWMKQG